MLQTPDHQAIKLEHLGVVSTNLNSGVSFLRNTLAITQWTEKIIDPLQKVEAMFGKDPSGMVFEVVAPLDEQSPIWRSARKSVDRLNHLAYRVKSIDAHTDRLKENRCIPLGERKPGIAFDDFDIQFFLTSEGWLLELIEQWDSTHNFKWPATPVNAK